MLRRVFVRSSELLCGTRFWTNYRQQKATSRSDIPHAKLRSLLLHATQNVPHWRNAQKLIDALDDELASPSDLLRNAPLTTKQDVKSGFPEKITAENGNKENWRFGSSAGTVDRVTIVSDFAKRDQIRATNLRVVDQLIGNHLCARIV